MKGIRTTLSALLTLMLLLTPASWNTQAEESGCDCQQKSEPLC